MTFLKQFSFSLFYINVQTLPIKFNFFQLPTTAVLRLNLQLHPQVSKNVFVKFFHGILHLAPDLALAESIIHFKENFSFSHLQLY